MSILSSPAPGRLFWRLALLLLAMPTFVAAQESPPPALTGFVWDTVSGAPVTRGSVLINGNIVAMLGRGGMFSIATLPENPAVTLKVWCRVNSIFVETVLERRLQLPPDSSWIELTVDGSKCDLRPLFEITGTFVGRFTSGFEHSEFIPCGVGARAWVDLDPGASGGVRWPRGSGRIPYYPEYFVRWRGTMEGPGRYGHMGVSDYLLRVTEILEVRNAGRNDCR